MCWNRFTKFSGITQCNCHHAVQGHSRSPILVPTSYFTPFPSYDWLLVKFLLARGECLTSTLSLGWSPANIAINDISLKTRFFGLHFRCRNYWCTFNHFYVIRPECYWIRWNYAFAKIIRKVLRHKPVVYHNLTSHEYTNISSFQKWIRSCEFKFRLLRIFLN